MEEKMEQDQNIVCEQEEEIGSVAEQVAERRWMKARRKGYDRRVEGRGRKRDRE